MNTGTVLTGFCASIALSGLLLADEPISSSKNGKPIDFVRDIRPIFSKRCYKCHGVEKQKGGFRLDNKTAALRGGDSGKVIQPGRSEASLLFKFIAGLDPDTVMPPKGDRLKPAEVQKIKAWIDSGAPWPDSTSSSTEVPKKGEAKHWSFIPPRRVKIPPVNEQTWDNNPIDRFILARLESEQLKPSPEAERPTLIRRLSFDLRGLPPTIEEIDTFVNDRNPGAYGRLVNRMLASPHFGERWGRHWLDLARYADSDGYEKDSVRPYAYLYRDWVVAAINRDVPFDEFSTQQLAGDLLPDATESQKIATGFHRNTLTNTEGGVDQEEFRCKATVDRVNTTGTVWLGLTVGCAECHSHKYDPITQREYYRLYAFFNNASEKDIPAPRSAELEAFQVENQIWERQQSKRKQELGAYLENDLARAQSSWEQQLKLPEQQWTVLNPSETSSAHGATMTAKPDGSIYVSEKNPDMDSYTIEPEIPFGSITGFRLEVFPDPKSNKGPGRSKNGEFVLSEFTVRVKRTKPDQSSSSKDISDPIQLANPSADHSSKERPAAGAIDGNLETGWAIAPQFGRRHVAVFETKNDLSLCENETLIIQLAQEHGKQNTIARFRLSASTSVRPLHADLMPDAVLKILRTSPDARSQEQRKQLAGYYRTEVDPKARQFDKHIAEHARKKPKFPETKAQTLVENEPDRETYIHIRGDFLRKGDQVEPGTPAILHPFESANEKPNRLDFARWLFALDNPLTSRVAVNRIWHHLFGRGFTPTMGDFGNRGEKPSHPELLDWLANEFTRLGWSRKALIRSIVNSATYKQGSRFRPKLADRDPNNILLARQNRFRLEAETIWDTSLAVSSLLNSEIGGPCIRPPLPADIAALGYANSVKWKASEGSDKHRRGLYIFFQRTVPFPMLVTFDAPDSNVSCIRRERSNTPLQALTLLNNPIFFECAQGLGRRLANTEFDYPEDRIRLIFRTSLARPPTEVELSRLMALYSDTLDILRGDSDRTAQIVGRWTGYEKNEPRQDKRTTEACSDIELAALIGVSRAVLNLDEFVTRQ